MDQMEARLECLKLALIGQTSIVQDPKPIVESAKAYSDYVIGDPVKSSASFGQKGKDEK